MLPGMDPKAAVESLYTHTGIATSLDYVDYVLLTQSPTPPFQVEQLGKRLGVNLASERVEDLKTMYGVFVESMIPTGEAALNGREADAIRDFKVALGLTDEEAAPVHLDVGRRLTRQGAEAGSREGSLLEKKVT